MIKFLMLVMEAIAYGIASVSIDAIYACIRGLVGVSTFCMHHSYRMEHWVCNARLRLVDHMHARQHYYTGGNDMNGGPVKNQMAPHTLSPMERQQTEPRGKTKLSDAMNAIEELRAFDEASRWVPWRGGGPFGGRSPYLKLFSRTILKK